MAKQFNLSPRGRFEYPWVNRADTQFNDDGLYHTKLVCGETAQVTKQREAIKAAAKAALAEHVDKMKPGEAKNWDLYLPYEATEDDDGNPTGETTFHFKQNAKIRLKDGSTKEVAIEIRDAADKVVEENIFGGDEGRVMYTMRPIVMSGLKQVGVRLDFFKVQLIKKGERKGGAGFGAVEDEDAFVSEGFGGAGDEEQGGDY